MRSVDCRASFSTSKVKFYLAGCDASYRVGDYCMAMCQHGGGDFQNPWAGLNGARERFAEVLRRREWTIERGERPVLSVV